jgi:hypothetical protein
VKGSRNHLDRNDEKRRSQGTDLPNEAPMSDSNFMENDIQSVDQDSSARKTKDKNSCYSEEEQ